jgi:hypothetical protein
MLIDVKELESLLGHIPAMLRKNEGVVSLIKFVAKTVHAVNALDLRLKKVEELQSQSKAD